MAICRKGCRHGRAFPRSAGGSWCATLNRSPIRKVRAFVPVAALCFVDNMPAFDTTPDAAAAQNAAYRQLGKVGRLKIAFQLTDLVRALAEAGIRKRNPDYTQEQIMNALARQLYGPDRSGQ